MKPTLRNFFLAASLILASTAANASIVTLDNVASSENRGGFYAGFYSLTIDSTSGILAMCDDFSTSSTIGDTWTANIYGYSTINSGGGKFGPNAVKYSQVGWLFSQAPSATTSQQASINEAIWKIMSPSAPTPTTLDGQNYFNSATGGSHDSFDYTNYMLVVTPLPFSASQEFLIAPNSVPPSSVVPLPAAAWLLGSGLTGLVSVARRKTV